VVCGVGESWEKGFTAACNGDFSTLFWGPIIRSIPNAKLGCIFQKHERNFQISYSKKIIACSSQRVKLLFNFLRIFLRFIYQIDDITEIGAETGRKFDIRFLFMFYRQISISGKHTKYDVTHMSANIALKI
jgi:hypothetical protein